MHRLVCSGYAASGQTGWDLLDSLTIDLILDFAYGEIVQGMTPEMKAQVDEELAKVSETVSQMRTEDKVAVTKRDGTVVYVSQERWKRLMNNRRAMGSLDPRRR